VDGDVGRVPAGASRQGIEPPVGRPHGRRRAASRALGDLAGDPPRPGRL